MGMEATEEFLREVSFDLRFLQTGRNLDGQGLLRHMVFSLHTTAAENTKC